MDNHLTYGTITYFQFLISLLYRSRLTVVIVSFVCVSVYTKLHQTPTSYSGSSTPNFGGTYDSLMLCEQVYVSL